MDRVSKETRSRNMAAVKSAKNKSTELKFLNLLRHGRVTGWRRGSKLYGKPDFAFSKGRKVIFVDGCFWHGCKKCRSLPKQNRSFWKEKISANKRRDRLVNRTLRRKDRSVLRIWEHDLAPRKREATLAAVKNFLTGAKIKK